MEIEEKFNTDIYFRMEFYYHMKQILNLRMRNDDEKEMIRIELRKTMMEAAEKLEFEKAAKIRDELEEFEKETGMTIA